MLDSELFVKIAAGGETDCEELHEDHNFTVGSTFNSHRVSCVGKENKYKKKSKSTKNKVSDRSAKERKSINNTEKSHSKVIVEMKQINKNNLRKQKYTKAIKNWLNNVESPHPMCGNVDKDCINEMKGGDKDNILENTEPNEHPTQMCDTPDKEIHIDKAQPAMRAKKVVQAQLANKNGIMKFSKPKITEKRAHTESATQQSTTKDNRNKVIKKFVAPIKYQTVEGVKFQVHLVDEENILSFNDSLLQAKDKEIIAVLIYSNGFCQLNSHYTDDTCSPSGIIICYNAMFYCFKTPGPNLKKALSYLLTNNIVVCYDARSVLMFLASHLELDIATIDMRDAKAIYSQGVYLIWLALSSQSSSVISTECSLQKSSWYMSQLKECWLKLLDLLIEHSLWDVFIDIEMKLIPIITAMELRGICVDMKTLNSMEQAVVDRLKGVEARCYEVAGRVFQVSSPAQVRALLYDELRLDEECNLDVGGTEAKGAKSTCETTVRAGGSVAARAAAPGAGVPTPAQGARHLPGRLQMASATGRIAASNPNLQAIPKAPFSLFLFPGADDARVVYDRARVVYYRARVVYYRARVVYDRARVVYYRARVVYYRARVVYYRKRVVYYRARVVYYRARVSALQLRACYVARPGRRLLAADFRHIECRVFAHLAADTRLLHALAQPRDFFTQLAADWLKKPESEVVAEERERTKRLVYASLYGAGPRKLMEILGVSYQRALEVAASFHRTFPSLKEFGGTVWRRCAAARGRVRSVRGRLRVLAPVAPADCAHAQRQALNFVVQGMLRFPYHFLIIVILKYASEVIATIQSRQLDNRHQAPNKPECAGSAADVCKMAMVATTRALDAADAALVLQVHDELVWEVDEHRLHDVAVRARVRAERAAAGVTARGRGLGAHAALHRVTCHCAGADWARMQAYTV
ncbi:unnamed protein product [Spodoptera littoralis]|uniref:DNA-directed DNA polymerase family A palm domain-containing protein n=1 Tax=Spodoptera littoralis TaxID=7109 RepID=A0A9P0IET0_SPOLI|nr:unnamed protein product [Spodoptera littoralis]CAH1645790.1 unnamed protein product [Spodoptera littoralis]